MADRGIKTSKDHMLNSSQRPFKPGNGGSSSFLHEVDPNATLADHILHTEETIPGVKSKTRSNFNLNQTLSKLKMFQDDTSRKVPFKIEASQKQKNMKPYVSIAENNKKVERIRRSNKDLSNLGVNEPGMNFLPVCNSVQ